MRAVIKCAFVRIPDWSNNAKKRAWSIALKLIEYLNTAGSALGFRPAPPGRGAFSFFCFMLHFFKGYDFGVTTQKGGVGKTTFTVLVASYLYYLKGYNVAVVDCDYPQHSISAMRKRDAEQMNSDEYYKQLAFSQFKALGKKAYPVLCSSPDEAIKTADEYLASAGMDYDVVFFDLPGTVNSEGVINSLSGVDYIFTPIAADRVVLESSLSFAVAIHKLLVKNEACRLKGLHLFWNMVDGREKTDLYTLYEQTIGELELPLMKVFIPDTKRFKKELDAQRKTVSVPRCSRRTNGW